MASAIPNPGTKPELQLKLEEAKAKVAFAEGSLSEKKIALEAAEKTLTAKDAEIDAFKSQLTSRQVDLDVARGDVLRLTGNLEVAKEANAKIETEKKAATASLDTSHINERNANRLTVLVAVLALIALFLTWWFLNDRPQTTVNVRNLAAFCSLQEEKNFLEKQVADLEARPPEVVEKFIVGSDIVRYVDREVPVEKTVYVDRAVPVDRIVYQDREVKVALPPDLKLYVLRTEMERQIGQWRPDAETWRHHKCPPPDVAVPAYAKWTEDLTFALTADISKFSGPRRESLDHIRDGFKLGGAYKLFGTKEAGILSRAYLAQLQYDEGRWKAFNETCFYLIWYSYQFRKIYEAPSEDSAAQFAAEAPLKGR